MASARYQSAWDLTKDVLPDQLRGEPDEFCTAAWREWLTAMVVVEMTRPERRVSWH